MKSYIEIGEMVNTLMEFMRSEKYNELVAAINGNTKEDGFRGALFTLPAIVVGNCTIYHNYEEKNTPKE